MIKISDEMRRNGLNMDVLVKEFSPTYNYTELISSGIITGKIDEVFEKVSNDLEEQTDAKLNFITSMVEPVLSILMGVMVGFLVLALFLPMFSIMDSF